MSTLIKKHEETIITHYSVSSKKIEELATDLIKGYFKTKSIFISESSSVRGKEEEIELLMDDGTRIIINRPIYHT